MTAALIARFEIMLDLCDRYGWVHLAELIYRQYIKLQQESAKDA